MGVRQNKVPVHDLQVGMFVSDLDRPWHETPFPIQGFYIRNDEEIRALASYCRYVYVDIAEAREAVARSGGHASAVGFQSHHRRGGQKVLKLPPIHVKNPRKYEPTVSLKREVKQGEKILADVRKALSRLGEQMENHEPLVLEDAEVAAEAMVGSVLRNPDALVWLSRIQRNDSYTYRHSLNTAIWSLVFGRHLGLQPDVLKHLALGSLLSQVGKADLSIDWRRQERELSAQELKAYRQYPEVGAQMLEEADQPPIVVSVVRYHRERHNGTGFPQGVTGDKIPLVAKICGLVDFYETMIEPREEERPLTPAQAVGQLFELRNIEFQEDLVERFIQAIGVYPTGTIVELSDQHVGVVLSHRPNRRLWPKVLVITDELQRPLKEGKVLDLADYNESRAAQDAVQVSGCIPFGALDFDPSEYQVTGAVSKWSWRHFVG
ncbi:DUF3391 domain-containing protein [Marinobacteraceae bacterium S3BR75-40.1]